MNLFRAANKLSAWSSCCDANLNPQPPPRPITHLAYVEGSHRCFHDQAYLCFFKSREVRSSPSVFQNHRNLQSCWNSTRHTYCDHRDCGATSITEVSSRQLSDLITRTYIPQELMLQVLFIICNNCKGPHRTLLSDSVRSMVVFEMTRSRPTQPWHPFVMNST
jgi:hypothetical protein